MKKIVITSLLLCCIFGAFSQDCLEKVGKQAVEIDSLKKIIILEKDNSTIKLKSVYDSITKTISKYQIEISNLNNKAGKLESDTSNLNQQIRKLDKTNLDRLEDQLKQKYDSIKLLNGIINQNESTIIAERDESIQKQKENYLEGQKNILSQIIRNYQLKDFDELIIASTKNTVETNLNIVGNDTTIKHKLENLQNYFAAQSVLENKFELQKQQYAQNQLNSINEKSELLDKLKTTIKDYQLCNDALKKTVGKIIDIDKKFIANDDYTQKRKLQDILVEFAWFFRNYRFDFIGYPYLSKIVLDIMKSKQKDANKDISDMLSQL